MEHLQDIVEMDIPCRYYISAKDGQFLLGIHQGVFEYFSKMTRKSEGKQNAEKISKMLGIGNFTISDKAFGFDKAFKASQSTDEFMEFTAKKGSSATQIVASLAIFSNIMDECRIQTNASFSQLINFRIHIRASSGAYGMIITGEISRIITEWLRPMENIILKEINAAAETCAINILGCNLDHIKVTARNGKFYTNRNNPDCGLHPFYPEDVDKGNCGQYIGGHNIDKSITVMESVIILAGLCDIYKQVVQKATHI